MIGNLAMKIHTDPAKNPCSIRAVTDLINHNKAHRNVSGQFHLPDFPALRRSLAGHSEHEIDDSIIERRARHWSEYEEED